MVPVPDSIVVGDIVAVVVDGTVVVVVLVGVTTVVVDNGVAAVVVVVVGTGVSWRANCRNNTMMTAIRTLIITPRATTSRRFLSALYRQLPHLPRIACRL